MGCARLAWYSVAGEVVLTKVKCILEFFRGLEISGKIFSRRYELSRGFEQGI